MGSVQPHTGKPAISTPAIPPLLGMEQRCWPCCLGQRPFLSFGGRGIPNTLSHGEWQDNVNQSKDVISQAPYQLGHPNLCEKCHQSSVELVAL